MLYNKDIRSYSKNYSNALDYTLSITKGKEIKRDVMKIQRIQRLRIDNDITIKDISTILGLQRDVYVRCEKGLRDFPVDVIIKLADYYNVSIDYLLERTDKKDVNK